MDEVANRVGLGRARYRQRRFLRDRAYVGLLRTRFGVVCRSLSADIIACLVDRDLGSLNFHVMPSSGRFISRSDRSSEDNPTA